MFSTMGNLNEGVAGRQDQNHTHKTGICSAPSAISERSRHSLKEDRHWSRHGLKKEKIQVRTSIRSYFWSDNAPCTLIQQDHQRKKWVYQKVLRNWNKHKRESLYQRYLYGRHRTSRDFLMSLCVSGKHGCHLNPGECLESQRVCQRWQGYC